MVKTFRVMMVLVAGLGAGQGAATSLSPEQVSAFGAHFGASPVFAGFKGAKILGLETGFGGTMTEVKAGLRAPGDKVLMANELNTFLDMSEIVFVLSRQSPDAFPDDAQGASASASPITKVPGPAGLPLLLGAVGALMLGARRRRTRTKMPLY